MGAAMLLSMLMLFEGGGCLQATSESCSLALCTRCKCDPGMPAANITCIAGQLIVQAEGVTGLGAVTAHATSYICGCVLLLFLVPAAINQILNKLVHNTRQ